MERDDEKSVTLPHDAMIHSLRSPDAPSGRKKGFFPDGCYSYTKKFHVPQSFVRKRILVEFEGAYMNAMVYINGDFAGNRPYGYANFTVKADPFLRYGEDNEIRVIVKSGDDSRWYTGCGLYRNVNLIVAEPVHIALDGLTIATPLIEPDAAVAEVSVRIENEGMRTCSLKLYLEITDAAGQIVARAQSPFTAFIGGDGADVLQQRLRVPNPRLWSVEKPNLYTCMCRLCDGDTVVDAAETGFGIRSLALDPVHGLRINGQTVKLRGACIHHDNGVLGAATIPRAEERRIEILKEAGFNAIRSAHHPASKALLEACDRLGMLVMDEAFDTWTHTKSSFDYALYFPTWWKQDIEAMVTKDINHPSVILYSIGNEIPETGHAYGALWGRKLAEAIRSLDSTRFTINSINAALAVMDQLPALPSQSDASMGFNAMFIGLGDVFKKMAMSDLVTEATAESYAAVDVAGYNYMDSRYEMDKTLFPNRVICGSETFCTDIAENWRMVLENNHVIGDFTWTGWDYLGESSLGRVVYDGDADQPSHLDSPYPWLAACSGDIDITGCRLPASYYREIVFGLRRVPYLCVRPPQKYGEQRAVLPWGFSDALESWSWSGFEGKPVSVEVYADADSVELLVNGNPIGRKPTGEPAAFMAVFEMVYAPGTLTAVAYKDGQEKGRASLVSAGDSLRLQGKADRETIAANDADLAYVAIALTDDQGVLKPLEDRNVSVTVEGAGILQGLGSANPKPDGNYFDGFCTTFQGRALAVIRPTRAGHIAVTISAGGVQSKTVCIKASGPDQADVV